jgi:hypothetical protein
VQIIREDIRAFGDAADYDRAAGHMELIGSGRIEGRGYELFGDRITATLLDDELERVLSDGNAMLLGQDIDVRAPVIDIGLAAGEVERMIAVSRNTDVQAHAVAEDFTLTADSIQADAPASVLERLTAVGRAHGERAPDSASADLPELIRSDWLRGDTIVGTFVQLEPPPADTIERADADTARTELETLTATGSARALYRMESADEETAESAVNYIVATQIALRMENGEVSTVDTIGPVEGVHLEPVRQASAEEADADADDDAPDPDAEGDESAGPAAERGEGGR